MTHSMPPATVPTVIAHDLPCAACGYNLRTLSPDAVCPECATPVAISMRSLLLRDADPAWLRRLRGAFGLWIVSLCWGLLDLAMGFLMLLGAPLALKWSFDPMVYACGRGGVSFISVVLYTWAVVRLTVAEPVPNVQRDKTRLRRWLRVAVLVRAALVLPLILWSSLFPTRMLWLVIYPVTLTLLVFATIGILVYIRSLAVRDQNPRLARWTSRVTWCMTAGTILGWAASGLFWWVMTIVDEFTASPSMGSSSFWQSATAGVLQCIRGLGTVILAVAYIWSIWLMNRYLDMLRRALQAKRSLAADAELRSHLLAATHDFMGRSENSSSSP